MKRSVWPIVVIALVVTFYLVRHFRGGASDTIDYRGEHFKMRKAYWTYEAYKDDPNNLDTNELEKIEKVMVEATFPSSFTSREEFIHKLFKLKFPGYGLGGTGSQPQTDDGSTLMVESVEIPQRDKNRYLVVRESGGHFALVDDFVSTTATNAITQVKLQARRLSYYDGNGSVVREKEMTTK
jgi:hypothetical protein